MAKMSGINYLMFKIRGQIVKVDPDIYYKIRNPGHEPPYRKYNDGIIAMQINDGYPVIVCENQKSKKYILLSRFVMNAKKGEIVDHIFGDKLDNRRKSLRIVTPRQNALNRKKSKTSTGFFGVTISRNRERNYCVGRFQISNGRAPSFCLPDNPHNRILAAFAHDKLVLQQGEQDYAPLNFPCFKNEPFRTFLLNEDLRALAE